MTEMDPANPAWRVIAQPLWLKALVAGGGVGLIALELWWFLGARPQAAAAVGEGEGPQEIMVTVGAGYEPSRIRVRSGRPVRLIFHRVNPSGCVDRVLFPDYHRSLDLPLNARTTIDLPAQRPGHYPFHCGMNMVRGEIEVVGEEG
jgi:plastocyanin domain-containing protein